MRFNVLHQFILARFQFILSSKLVYEAFVSKCHKVWHYVMCATSATNATKCGAVNRAVFIEWKENRKVVKDMFS